MANNATWNWSAILGVTVNGVCWQSVYQTNGDFTHTCLDEKETIPCTATVRFLNGQKVKYTFTCHTSPALAGQVRRSGSDLFIERFDTEDWS